MSRVKRWGMEHDNEDLSICSDTARSPHLFARCLTPLAGTPRVTTQEAYMLAPRTKTTGAPRAMILTVQHQLQSNEAHLASYMELDALATTLGIEIVEVHAQKRTHYSRETYLGRGKLDALIHLLRARTEASDANKLDLILVNDALSPKLQRTLELELGVEIMDRPGVILETFERRARTHQARIEVEIARLKYDLPRLRDDTTQRGREGGGGRGERGNKLVELEKQRVRARIATLTSKLAAIQSADEVRKRRRRGTYQVALLGYTNAGKSSLLGALTGSEVYVEDQLFATLSTTARQLQPAANSPVVISDTVGFISELPHELVASFHSTLEEARDADLVLLVLDASDPSWSSHLAVTRSTLEELGVQEDAVRIVFNKCDRLSLTEREVLETEHPRALMTSAASPDEVAELREWILAIQAASMSEVILNIPADRGELRGEVFERARVLEDTYTEHGNVLRVRAPEHELERLYKSIGARCCGLLEHAWRHGLELDPVDDSTGVDEGGVRWELDAIMSGEARSKDRNAERACRLLRDHVPFEVPLGVRFSSGVRARRELPGEPANEGVNIDELAALLRSVWGTNTQDAFEAGLSARSIRVVRAQRRDALERVLTEISLERAWVDSWRSWLERDDVWPEGAVLIHGSMGRERLHVGASGEIVAVDGWEVARVDDPGEDLLSLLDDGLLPQGWAEQLEARGCSLWDGVEEHVALLRSFEPVLRASEILATQMKGARDRAASVLAMYAESPRRAGSK